MFDTHAHVHDAKFDVDRAAMLARAQKTGVERIVTVGCDLADSRRALEVASEFGLQASIGVHPHEARDAPADLAAALDTLRAEAPVQPVAVGETGLDYYYDHSPRDVQRAVMAAQVRYARGGSTPPFAKRPLVPPPPSRTAPSATSRPSSPRPRRASPNCSKPGSPTSSHAPAQTQPHSSHRSLRLWESAENGPYARARSGIASFQLASKRSCSAASIAGLPVPSPQSSAPPSPRLAL